MEQLGASILNLRPIRDEEQEDDKFETLIPSTRSLSAFEKDSLKCLIPQIIASMVAALFNIQGGVSMGYSAVLISQLEQPDSDFKTTKAQNAFMASIVILVAPPASVLSGLLMDRIGRINTIKTALVPGLLGWATIALAQDMNVVILGRVLIGIASCFGTNPATVYITEIAHPKLRMSLLQLSPIYASLGMILAFLIGWFVSWRTLAWATTALIILPIVAVCFVNESPSWLIFRGRYEEAKKSLNWLYRYQPNIPGKGESFASLQYKVLKRQHDEAQVAKASERGVMDKMKDFLKPTGYKPLIIMLPMYFCQHFSGVYVTMFYSIMFIEEAGAEINPYFASSMIGLIRFIMAMVNVIILKHVARRKAIGTSALGMAFCMFISGLFTLWIKDGTSTATWVPVAGLLMYVVFSVTGLMFLPFMITSELFPLEIRGIGYTVGYSLSTVFMFSAIQGYYWMTDVLGSHTHLQWFFAVVALAGLVYSYMFLPETKGKKLSDISENFNKGWLYIGKDHK